MRLAPLLALLLAAPTLHAQADLNPPEAYYPLHVGDQWEYREYDMTGSPPAAFRFVRRTVTKDTVAGGHRYAIVRDQGFRAGGGGMEDRRRLLRFDTTEANVREYYGGGSERDLLQCRLDLAVPAEGGLVPCGTGPLSSYGVAPDSTIAIGGSVLNTSVRRLYYFYFTESFAANVGSLGAIGCEGGCSDLRLEYARVAGVEYGQKIPGLGHDPDPTPAQAYAPLAVGNRWEYRIADQSGGTLFGYRRETILRDSLLDGETWRVLRAETFSPERTPTGSAERLVRFDAAAANVLQRTDTGTSLRYLCRLDLDLTGDGAFPDCQAGVSYSKGPATVLGVETTRLTFGYDFGSVSVAAGFGFVSSVDEGRFTTLVFARIDGQTFGTAVADEAGAEPDGAFALTAAPNPTTGALRLALTLPAAQTVRLEAFDALGRRVWQQTAALAAGAQALTVDASAWAPGVYVVRAAAGQTTATARVVRQ